MVQRHRGDAPHRTGFALYEEFAARCGQGVLRAVKVEKDEAARRVSQVVHTRDGFLSLVASLLEVHGGAGVVQLLRNGFVVDFGTCARAPGFDAQRLRRPDARQLSAFREGGELIAGNNAQVPFVVGAGMRVRRCAVMVAAFDECRPRVAPYQCIRKDRMDSALFPARVSGSLDNGVLSAHILNIDAKHELHAVQVVGERFRLCTLDDEPERLPVLDGGGCIFDASLRGE